MLLIYIPENSERCQYVLELIFKQELGIEYRIVTNHELFDAHQEEKINYSNSRVGSSFFINAALLLFEKGIRQQNIIVTQNDQAKVLFANKDCDLGFDIFSSVFYMISRYEEYLPFKPDNHGRFKASDSVAFKHNFLQQPIVNIWIDVFKNILQQRFPSLKMKPSSFNAIITYDIDVAYKFKGRSIFRTLGSTAKDILKLNLKNIYQRLITLLNLQKDPWDVYNYLRGTALTANLKPIFFFLMADKSTNDRNLDYKTLRMKSLIKKVMEFSDTGIHPSYASSEFPEKITIEKERLQQICGKKITKSRQHYLKFVLPGTYRALIAAGIIEDYSMGFSEMAGFRAGTCKPFYFYDLEEEQSTELKIFPVTCMEATFIYYSKISPEKSLVEILTLLEKVKKVGGTFISIWHNENLGESRENKKWNSVYHKMIMQIKSI